LILAGAAISPAAGYGTFLFGQKNLNNLINRVIVNVSLIFTLYRESAVVDITLPTAISN